MEIFLFPDAAAGLSNQQLLVPTAAERLDELHIGDQPLAGKLRRGLFGLQFIAAGVHDFKVADDAGGVALRGELGCAFGMFNRPLLRRGLVGQIMDGREAVFHIAESDQHLLLVLTRCFGECGLRTPVIRAQSSAGKDWQ